MSTVLTRYGFRNCMGAFSQMDTRNARNLLPRHLQPVEAQHGRSVLAILAFQFTESEVGAYDELVMAIITPPRIEPRKALPKAAFYPIVVATSTEAARAHAIERWHLPHYPEDLSFQFEEGDGQISLEVREASRPVIDLGVFAHEFRNVVNPYHAFTVAETSGTPYKVNIFMEAPHSEHEAERGRLTLHDHPMLEGLDSTLVDPIPFREEWYQAGIQTFEELETL